MREHRVCPMCGRPLDPAYQVHQRSVFEAPAPWERSPAAPPSVTEATRKTPAGKATLDGDVMVPLFQAVITAITVSLFVIPLAMLMGWPLSLALVAFALVLMLAWLRLLVDQRSLLWSVETIIREDIDGDGHIGQPQLPTPRVEVSVSDQGHIQLDDLPGPLNELRAFVKGVVEGYWTFSERGAAESGYGVTRFKELRTRFIERGWASWNNAQSPQQGVRLTRKGWAVIRGTSDTTDPLPRR